MIFLFTRSRKAFARAMYSVPLFGIVREKKCCIVIGRKRLRRGNSAATCLSKVISGANIQFDVSKFKFLTSNIRASTFDFDDFRVGKKDV